MTPGSTGWATARRRVSLERRDLVPTADFRLVYTLTDGAFGASILSYRPSSGDDGYFLLLASPEVKAPDARPQPKTVIFVLDRSGSMAGKKIEQARKALKSVLNNLRDDDLFNIVVYDDRVESFRPELERYGSRIARRGRAFRRQHSRGRLDQHRLGPQDRAGLIRDDSRPSYVLFLTDGLPTVGETQELRIADNCRQANSRHARLFCFGVGFDVNARLLDRLSGGNSGTSEYVKPDEDLEAHVGRFYSKLTSPVLVDLRVELTGTDVNRTYPRDLPDLFDGGQIIWVGRYRQSGRTTLRISGKVGGERRSFEFPAELADSDRGSGHEFVERIWAIRRVGYLIDQIDMSRPEQGADRRARQPEHQVRDPHPLHLIPGRRAGPASRRRAEREPGPRILRTAGRGQRQFAVAQRDLKQSYMRADKAGMGGSRRWHGQRFLCGRIRPMMGRSARWTCLG